jgi:hypothetical protein
VSIEIIIHRVNSINGLKRIKPRFGTEIDIRAWGSEIILNHEPFSSGERIEDYLDEYRHGTLILNIKEAGIEDEVLSLVRQRPQIKSYFLLDIEFPYIYRATRQGERAIAIRFSEDEPIEFAKKYVGKIDWVWIDTNTQMPVGEHNLPILNMFKKCLVCPERWGRPSDIANYKNLMSIMDFKIDAVMTSNQYINLWES